MDHINNKLILQILAPLNLPEGVIKVEFPVIRVLHLADKPEEYRQLEQARLALVQAGWDAVETDAWTLVMKGPHPDPEYVKFMQAAPGSNAFEGLVNFKIDQKLLNEM